MMEDEKVRQISEMYTKRVRDILVENRKFLQVEIERIIFETSIEGKISEYVRLQNTMDIVDRYISAYEQASCGYDIDSSLAMKTHSLVKSTLDIDTFKEWEGIRRDIKSKLGRMPDQELIRYLIRRYGVIGTGEIIAKRPEGLGGFVSDVKWLLYIAAVALNKVVRSALLR